MSCATVLRNGAEVQSPRHAAAVAAGSEQISVRWVEGAVRACRQCGVKITNLSKQVGEVRSVYPGPRGNSSA